MRDAESLQTTSTNRPYRVLLSRIGGQDAAAAAAAPAAAEPATADAAPGSVPIAAAAVAILPVVDDVVAADADCSLAPPRPETKWVAELEVKCRPDDADPCVRADLEGSAVSADLALPALPTTRSARPDAQSSV